MHFHFGKDGGAERFFVHLVNALARAGVEQKAVIRRNRIWRPEIERAAEVTERNYRDATLDRLLLPWWVTRTTRTWQPNAYFAWMPKACRVLPRKSNCLRIARLGDYPLKLSHFCNVDVLVCNTPGIVTHVKQMGWQREIECISNFTNTNQVEPIDRSLLETPPEVPLITSVGRFVTRKGFDVLLHSLVKTPGAYMWLLGDGEQRDNLHNLARDLGVLNRVRFTGWIADPRPYLAASNVFAMASSHEPLGNVILEAWAQRVPVVSTRSEGPQWFMRDSRNGLLVDIGDSGGFATGFRKILEDPALAKQLVAGGATMLDETFSERAVVNAYLNLISSQNAQRQAA